ncbi:MAG TPA: SDR family NAD(P)-dependent oxidoreductase, partial [Rubrobacteraceae bacterium]|nr:SDR family NAD(P)-dependent oxidoreductase [Rubrobacteraceae bacterium]
MDLGGRVALVTGASRGIGAAIAERLSGVGADVAVGYGNDEESAGKVVARVEPEGRRAVAVGGDLRDPAAVEEMCSAVESSLGPVDVLVSNAGIAPKQSFEEITDSDW